LQYIDKYRAKILTRKYYKLFKLVVSTVRYSTTEEKMILKKADKYRINRVRGNIFTKWKNWYFNYRRNKL